MRKNIRTHIRCINSFLICSKFNSTSNLLTTISIFHCWFTANISLLSQKRRQALSPFFRLNLEFELQTIQIYSLQSIMNTYLNTWPWYVNKKHNKLSICCCFWWIFRCGKMADDVVWFKKTTSDPPTTVTEVGKKLQWPSPGFYRYIESCDLS